MDKMTCKTAIRASIYNIDENKPNDSVALHRKHVGRKPFYSGQVSNSSAIGMIGIVFGAQNHNKKPRRHSATIYTALRTCIYVHTTA